MTVQRDKNEKFRYILELAYKESQNFKPDVDRREPYIEFAPNEMPNSKEYEHFDPDGTLTGCSFELASRGLLIPRVLNRMGLSNFAFIITDFGKSLVMNKTKLEVEFPTSRGNYAFVIMSFSDNPTLKDAYELAIKPSIEIIGLQCLRVDEIEHNRRITDKVMECIKHARIIIADLTEQRPNCYYELGFAHALEKEVIHTIKESEPIHFDVKDYNFIVYPNVTELKSRLEKRIQAIMK